MITSVTKSKSATVFLKDEHRKQWESAINQQTMAYPENGYFESFVKKAASIALEMIRLSPELASGLDALRENRIVQLKVGNLPQDKALPPAPTDGLRPRNKGPMTEYILLGLMKQIAEPFAYTLENGGRLTHEVAPKDGEENKRSSAGRRGLAGHIDNSFLWSIFRPTYLALLGLINERSVPTLIYELDEIVARLSRRNRRHVDNLFKKEFRIHTPDSFKGFRNPIWVEELALLESDNGTYVAGFNHGYNVQGMTTGAAEAYAALCEVIDEMKAEGPAEVVIEPGTALLFANCRVLHARPEIESGVRWLQRVYGTSDLAALQSAASTSGRIFDPRLFL